jgi:hypothetical protein
MAVYGALVKPTPGTLYAAVPIIPPGSNRLRRFTSPPVVTLQ